MGGIPEMNVLEFEYRPGESEDGGGRLDRNLTQVLVTRDGLFKYSFDMRTKPKPGGFGPEEKREGDYRNEKVIKFAKD
jgi:hypothetical protein